VSGNVVAFGVLVVATLAACVVWSRVGIVGPTALRPPEPTKRAKRGRAQEPPREADLAALWLVLGPVAAVGAAGCAVVGASTFLRDGLVVPRAAVVACFATALPLVATYAVTVGQLKQKRRSVLSTIESGAPDAWPTGAILLVAFFFMALTGAGGPSGDATERDGRYFLNNHGVHTPISQDEYERYETLERRTIAGIIGAGYAPGIALGMYAYGLRNRDRERDRHRGPGRRR
jgi:hypothetical protein